jgi:hypothetical protein
VGSGGGQGSRLFRGANDRPEKLGPDNFQVRETRGRPGLMRIRINMLPGLIKRISPGGRVVGFALCLTLAETQQSARDDQDVEE